MIIVMLGAPGTGKGTISALMSKYYDIPHISTGDLLREFIRSGKEDSIKIQEYINNGHLVPDEYINRIVEKRIQSFDCKNGFIIDGYPRTIVQADMFGQMLKENNKEITAAINLETSEEEIINRIVNRIVCPNCKAIYNLKTAAPVTAGICDVCDSQLVRRSDDTEEKVKERLKEYYEKTYDLVQYYQDKNKLFTLIVSEELGKLDKEVLKEIVWYIEGLNESNSK